MKAHGFEQLLKSKKPTLKSVFFELENYLNSKVKKQSNVTDPLAKILM